MRDIVCAGDVNMHAKLFSPVRGEKRRTCGRHACPTSLLAERLRDIAKGNGAAGFFTKGGRAPPKKMSAHLQSSWRLHHEARFHE